MTFYISEYARDLANSPAAFSLIEDEVNAVLDNVEAENVSELTASVTRAFAVIDRHAAEMSGCI
jgi:hypothetical protein